MLEVVRGLVANMGIEQVITSYRSPWQTTTTTDPAATRPWTATRHSTESDKKSPRVLSSRFHRLVGCIIDTSGPPEHLAPSPFLSHPLVNGTGSVCASSLFPVHRGVTAQPDPGRSGVQHDLVCGVVPPVLVKSTRL